MSTLRPFHMIGLIFGVFIFGLYPAAVHAAKKEPKVEKLLDLDRTHLSASNYDTAQPVYPHAAFYAGMHPEFIYQGPAVCVLYASSGLRIKDSINWSGFKPAGFVSRFQNSPQDVKIPLDWQYGELLRGAGITLGSNFDYHTPHGVHGDAIFIDPERPWDFRIAGRAKNGLNYDFVIDTVGGQSNLRTTVSRYGVYLSDQRLGELSGVGGPLFVHAISDYKPVINIYDAAGVPVGTVTREQAMKEPIRMRDLYEIAELRSRVKQSRHLQGWTRGMGYIATKPELDLSKIIQMDKSFFNGSMQIQSVLMPQLGLSVEDRAVLAEAINTNLAANAREMFTSFHCCAAIYTDEKAFVREFWSGDYPDDGLYWEDRWSLRAIGFERSEDFPSVWDVARGQDKNVLVALIDTGLDLDHPDGPEYIWRNSGEVPDNGIDDDENGFVDDVHGWNFADENNDLSDMSGHGTRVAGIIAAKTNNREGVAGINPGAEIMVLKVADKNGRTNNFQIYRALRYAADHGAKIINISAGGQGLSKLEQLGINYAAAHEALIVVPAGDKEALVEAYSPASLKGVVTVGALTRDRVRSPYGNWGAGLKLLAPGDRLYTLRSDDRSPSGQPEYDLASGSSLSAAIITATASLLWSKYPEFTVGEIKRRLYLSGEDMEQDGWDDVTGYGVFNAMRPFIAKPEEELVVHIDSLRPAFEKGRSVDVVGTVQGEFDHFIVELGKGKMPEAWTKIAGPFIQPADEKWICRAGRDHFKGSRYWVVRITVFTKDGKSRSAQSAMNFKD